MVEREGKGEVQQELHKLLEQANALAEALARRLEEELGPKLEKAARAVEEKLSRIDWEQLEKEGQEMLRKGLQRAREALDKALLELEKRSPSPTRPEFEEDERLVILRMVAEGRISPEEGAKLLEALGG